MKTFTLTFSKLGLKRSANDNGHGGENAKAQARPQKLYKSVPTKLKGIKQTKKKTTLGEQIKKSNQGVWEAHHEAAEAVTESLEGRREKGEVQVA